MGSPSADSVDWLQAEYSRRKRINPRYSLRAFAQHLSLPSGPLSEILARKRFLTPKLAQRVAEKLRYPPEERARFFQAVEREKASHGILRGLRAKRGERDEYRQVSEDRFALIAEWHHFAILALLETEGCPQEPRWMARRLGIRASAARVALERLERLGLLQRVEGRYVPGGNLTTPQDVPSRAVRSYHRQTLARAAGALEGVALERRDITSITVAVDPSKLMLAKRAIKRFRREMARLLESGRKEEVYSLTILLFPVTEERTNDA